MKVDLCEKIYENLLQVHTHASLGTDIKKIIKYSVQQNYLIIVEVKVRQFSMSTL